MVLSFTGKSGARGQTAIELFLVLSIFLTVFVWTNGFATVVEGAKTGTAAVQSEAILRSYVNHATSAYVDQTNITIDEPCLTIGGQGYAYFLNSSGSVMTLHSAALGVTGNYSTISCVPLNCPLTTDSRFGVTGLFVPACANRTPGKACMAGINPPDGNSSHLTAGACA